MEEKLNNLPTENENPKGAFFGSLTRNNKQIRADRAAAISEDTMLMFKRKVEDLEVRLRRLKMDRENLLDMSPDNSMSLKLASDFNSEEFIDKDLKLGLAIRETEILLDIASSRYHYLFG